MNFGISKLNSFHAKFSNWLKEITEHIETKAIKLGQTPTGNSKNKQRITEDGSNSW